MTNISYSGTTRDSDQEQTHKKMLGLTGFKVELLLNNVVACLRGLILKHLLLNGL